MSRLERDEADAGGSDQFRHVGYTCIWNICDCPAAIFPALRADRKLDPFDPTYQPRNADDLHVHRQCTSRDPSESNGVLTQTRPDDPALNHGSPVALQLVARKLEEEKLLKMVEVVSAL